MKESKCVKRRPGEDNAHYIYRDWLYHEPMIIFGESREVQDENLEHYVDLFNVLYDTEFTWPEWMVMDENRAGNGKYMRYEFSYLTGIDLGDWRDWPCSVLEMLLGFSRDIENKIMRDIDIGDRSYYWFWLMLNNLGLDWFTSSRFRRSPRKAIEEIENGLYIFMNRTYGDDGFGSVFPLTEDFSSIKGVVGDQFKEWTIPQNKKKNGPKTDENRNWNEVELWYQANFYFGQGEMYQRYGRNTRPRLRVGRINGRNI